MPTPLETYLIDLRAAGGLALDRSRLAIGADNQYATLLRAGVQAHVNASSGGKIVPNCLAWFLLEAGKAWSQEANDQWLDGALADSSGAVPTHCYVYHAKINEALNAGKVDGAVTVAAFNEKYAGNKNSSYGEIVKVLGAGYTKVKSPCKGGGVRLSKPA
ncbi:hypothetical protein [Frateuria sp. YIM B11624]|uniref:hypothetical protein n=1 Tax=Frateuria sp. YIM B11624 TaxID=3143185 RepID=UPI003C7553BD